MITWDDCVHDNNRDHVHNYNSGHIHNGNNINNILYSSQQEIKAVIQSHNEEHISIILSRETHTYTLLDICPLSLSLHALISNPKLPAIMLSLSNQTVKTLK